MPTTTERDLEAARERVAKLEQIALEERARELASLPGKYGFRSVASFVKAVKAAASGDSRSASLTGSRRKRAVITPDTKARLKALFDAGKTGAEMADALDISLPSVHNIKKELGLVKSRS